MATVTKLKESLSEVIFLVTGTTQETNTKIVDASTLSNAIVGPSFHHLILRELSWSIGNNATMTLSWEGTPNLPFLYLSNSGFLELSDKIGTKITNTATAATGDVLITTSAAAPYTLLIVLEKASGSYDKSEKFNY